MTHSRSGELAAQAEQSFATLHFASAITRKNFIGTSPGKLSRRCGAQAFLTRYGELSDQPLVRFVERIVQPYRLQRGAWVALPAQPLVQCSENRVRAPQPKQSARLFLLPAVLRERPVEQLFDAEFGKVRLLHGRPPLGRHAPDAAVFLVATRVAEIH